MEWRKKQVIETLQLISDKGAQDKYHEDVKIANIATELVNQWFDDSFYPDKSWMKELFSNNEWQILLDFHDFFDARVSKLPDSYEEIRDDFFWKEIIGKADYVLTLLGWKET